MAVTSIFLSISLSNQRYDPSIGAISKCKYVLLLKLQWWETRNSNTDSSENVENSKSVVKIEEAGKINDYRHEGQEEYRVYPKEKARIEKQKDLLYLKWFDRVKKSKQL